MNKNGKDNKVLVDLSGVRGPRIFGTIGVNAEVAEWEVRVGKVLDDVKVVSTFEAI